MLTEEAKELLIEKGYSPEFGARPLRRAIEHLVEDPLAEKLLKGDFQGKDSIVVGVETVDGEQKLSFKEGSGTATSEMVTAGNEGKG